MNAESDLLSDRLSLKVLHTRFRFNSSQVSLVTGAELQWELKPRWDLVPVGALLWREPFAAPVVS